MPEGPTTSAETLTTNGTVCPFCAHVRTDTGGSCPKCTMEDTPTTRRSTGERIGPWFVLQRKNPTAPGLRLSVLLTLARRGHITPKSIVRGPTTGQFWRYAAQVKGLSRVFGTCWHCGAGVSPDAMNCPSCRSAQEIPDDPDQFIENHSAVPVMREVPISRDMPSSRDVPALAADTVSEKTALVSPSPIDRALPSPRRELPSPAERAIETKREHRPATGTRSVTLARGENDVILSASELAAAFQLDMPRESAAAPKPRRLWRATKAAAILLLVASAATAATLYLKPDWRRTARAVAQPYWEKTQSLALRIMGRGQRKSTTLEDLNQLPAITPIQLEPALDLANGQGTSDEAGQTKASNNTSVDTKQSATRIQSVWDKNSQTGAAERDAPIDALAGQASVFQPTTHVAITPSQKLTDRPEVVVSRPNEPQSKSTADRTEDASNAPDKSLDQAIAAAADLRKNALDAEARKDWKSAVVIYEQIAMLPEAAHPSDLKVKLSVARDRARS